ncbi:MAG TPA: APC family permease [Gemmatimonadaceae bacterium]|nr:APC family permease [Gemmatimonadaceae bacterium]
MRELAAGIVTITIGGGVFLLPAVATEALGAAAWLSYALCALVFALVVSCFAEAGSRVADTGGPYAFVGEAFGPFWGYLTGVLVLLFATTAHAAVVSGLAQTLNALVPGIGEGGARVALLTVTLGCFTLINARGVRQGAVTVEIGTVAKLVPLLFLGTFGLFKVHRANLAWPGMPDAGTLTRTTMMMMFAFFGVESALGASGEVRDPARTVPRAIFAGIGVVTVVYLAVQEAAQGILGPDILTHRDAPLAAAAAAAFGHWAGAMLAIGAAVSMVAHTSGMMLSLPRNVFALARDGYLPASLARVSPRTQAPVNAIVAYGAVVLLLSATGTFTSLLVLANAGALLMYLLCCLAVLGLRRRNVRLEQPPFTIPGGAAVPWVAAAAIVALLSTLTGREVLAIGAALAVAVALYAARARRHAAATTGGVRA